MKNLTQTQKDQIIEQGLKLFQKEEDVLALIDNNHQFANNLIEAIIKESK
jgi:hypothetical protein